MTHQDLTQPETPQRPHGATTPSERAPDSSMFRRPSEDPTLGDGQGSKHATTPAWAPTPTLTDRRVLDAPAFVVGTSGESSGARVAAALERLGRTVDLVDPGRPGVPVASDRTLERPIYPAVVHVSSVEAVTSPAADSVTRAVAAYRPGATITYDVALRPDSMGSPDDVRARVEELIAQADVVKVSARDLEWLYPREEYRDVVGRWLSSGPGIAIVSAGTEGTTAVNAVGATARSAAPAPDGDDAEASFTAALIDALWKGGLLGGQGRADLRTLVWWSLQELLDHAAAAASITAGGQAPTREELASARGMPRLLTT